MKEKSIKSKNIKDYLMGYIESDEDLVELGYHKNERFIDDVVEEYERNLKYVEYGYSEINAKDNAIETVSNKWKKLHSEKYFEIHVTKDSDGYTILLKAKVDNEDEAVQYAIKNRLFEEDGDEQYIDYVVEIEEADYYYTRLDFLEEEL